MPRASAIIPATRHPFEPDSNPIAIPRTPNDQDQSPELLQ